MEAHRILRRTVEIISRRGDDHKGDVSISPIAGLIFFLTCVACVVVLFTINYTFGQVLPILCMVESSETSAYVPVNSIAVDDEPPAYDQDEGQHNEVAEEINLVRNKPFTTSLRATVRHLRARAGFWSIFRGFGLYFVLSILRNILVVLFSLVLPTKNFAVLRLAVVIAEIVLANFHMTWVHIIISEPSAKRWWQRLPRPAFQAWRRVAPAVALWAVTSQVVIVLPLLVMGVGVNNFPTDPGRKELNLVVGQIFGALILMLVLSILLEIPAMVTMVRVAASMLPEEDETIVPFDRSYGGKVRPAIVGGEGKIGLLEAWKSFTWASRRRLIMMCVKVVGLVMAVEFGMIFVIMLEAHLLFNPDAFVHLVNGIRHALLPGSH